MNKAESHVTEAQQRLIQLEQDKAELDKQLRETQDAVLAGKRKVEGLRTEVQRRTEARTVRLQAAALQALLRCSCYTCSSSHAVGATWNSSSFIWPSYSNSSWSAYLLCSHCCVDHFAAVHLCQSCRHKMHHLLQLNCCSHTHKR